MPYSEAPDGQGLTPFFHQPRNQQACGNHRTDMPEPLHFIQRYSSIAYTLKHSLKVKILFIACHQLQMAVARHQHEARRKLANVVQRRITVNQWCCIRDVTLLTNGKVCGSLSSNWKVTGD